MEVPRRIMTKLCLIQGDIVTSVTDIATDHDIVMEEYHMNVKHPLSMFHYSAFHRCVKQIFVGLWWRV